MNLTWNLNSELNKKFTSNLQKVREILLDSERTIVIEWIFILTDDRQKEIEAIQIEFSKELKTSKVGESDMDAKIEV